jgi:hypothetical protein
MNGLTDLAAGLPWSRRVTLIAALLALIACLGYGAVSVRDANASQTVLEEEGEQKLTAAPGEASERSRFGSSVALSGNGELALVGAPSDDGGVGAAFTFSRSEEGGWTQQGTPLTVPAANTEGEGCSSASSEEIEEAEEGEEAGEEGVAEAHACHFGRSVALSEDGSTAVVGAPREDGSRGAVWIYTRSGSSWTQATELSSPEPGLSRHFGVSVAASANGDTIAVGAPLLRGRVWVFTRSGSSWVAVGGALAGPDEEGEAFFGHSIALSADGETVAVGGPGDNGKHGAAWIFTRSGPGWVQQGSKITGAGEISEGRFGSSVALSGDGSTALVGARGDDEGVGAAWLYSETGSGWAQQGPMLKGHEEASEGFGYSVALSSGGTRALVGADDGENARGDARLFERSGSTWQLQAQLGAKLTQRGAARYGSSVALSSEGRWMLLGGPFSEKMGAAWMFGPRPSVTAVKPESGPSDGGTKVEIQGENLTGTEAVSFGAVAADEFEVTSAKSILVTSPPGVGKVDITVKTPFGVSSTSEADEFTYKISTGRGGGGGKGAGGEGGASGSGGSGAAAGGTTPGASGPSSETVVLGFGATHAPSCGASLLSRKISVQRNYRALLKLVGAGAGACSGKLRLQVRTKVSKRRYRTRTIGTASFSIAASTRVTVKIRLNGLGRALLASRHGSLEASLVIVKSKPSPTRAHTASVRLTRR